MSRWPSEFVRNGNVTDTALPWPGAAMAVCGMQVAAGGDPPEPRRGWTRRPSY